MIQTAIIIALTVTVAALVWKLHKLIKDMKETSELLEIEKLYYQRAHNCVLELNNIAENSDGQNKVWIGYDDIGWKVFVIRANHRINPDRRIWFCVKHFPYDHTDEADKAYTRLCAEELKEAIEYDWRINEGKK